MYSVALLGELIRELWTLICDHDARYSESAQYMVVEKLPRVVSYWILGKFGFYSLGEVVDCHNDVIDLAWSCWQRSNEIHPPHVERPHR